MGKSLLCIERIDKRMNEIEIRKTVNKTLVAFLLAHGVQPIRLELSEADKTIIYVYDVAKTKGLYKLWKRNKPNKKI